MGRVDAASVFIHEFVHALGLDGWGDVNDESPPANYASPWDMNARLEGGTLFFTGTQAQAVYGGPAPVRALTSPVAGPRRHSAVGGDLGL